MLVVFLFATVWVFDHKKVEIAPEPGMEVYWTPPAYGGDCIDKMRVKTRNKCQLRHWFSIGDQIYAILTQNFRMNNEGLFSMLVVVNVLDLELVSKEWRAKPLIFKTLAECSKLISKNNTPPRNGSGKNNRGRRQTARKTVKSAASKSEYKKE